MTVHLPETLSSNYRNVRVVVFGATGFIGSWVSQYLSAAGSELHLVVRDSLNARKKFTQLGIKGTIWDADLSDLQQAQDILQKLQPAVIFNLAGYGVDRTERNEQRAYQINARLVETIAQTLLKIPNQRWQGMNLIHVGSALEYGDIGGDLLETSTPNPTTLYGRSKLKGTLIVKKYGQMDGTKGVTARLFMVYGPGEHQGRLLPSLIKAANTNEPISFTAGYQKRDFEYVGDVAEGLLRIGVANVPQGEIINLATGKLTSVRQFSEKAADILSIPRDRLDFGALPDRSEEMNHDPVNIHRLVQHTGWKPTTSIADGIRSTFDFEQKRMKIEAKKENG